ncbi:winged helix-turn-helix domain-containing protein [Verrucosispora sp. WMMA2044]|uniref:Winged helix-turn-helix domain-containing protein n=1 Tax=Verrucosispora sioxanthis TaxID=2499994 RepID=A0A6M1LCT3_9ACTN|nr:MULTISPECIES: winged helix-turn-helix domain-containing protein [Micromonospora]NEE66995.1 winged helix-turn-helix domain-containing protein [Verrucosispora sioxanthis]NGM16105.1 winged helix-turn-helix domain-containing protein [Verrucosispora sioxanthis]WBB47450.1 winged helix-turn-helix domain-containing protein [Verrucosispora sp. WMMA2044]
MTDETLDQLGDALSDLHRVLRRRALQRTGRAALPDAQVEVLRLVQRQPGISVREAAARLGTAANTVSTLVGELTTAGLLRRDRDPADRRTVRLALTEVAYERIAAYGRYRRELLAAALADLDATDRERLRTAVPALSRLADHAAELP